MLSGIRKGKKKKRKVAAPPQIEGDSLSAAESLPTRPLKTSGQRQSSENQSIADQLRQNLAAGNLSAVEATTTKDLTSSTLLERLERRGRISANSEKFEGSTAETIVVDIPGLTAAGTTSKGEEDMDIHELAAQERAAGGMSLDEQMTRNLARVGKKRRRKVADNEDSDEELERMKRLLPKQEQDMKPKAVGKSQQRDLHRQIAEHHQQQKITKKCSWWLESATFSKHRLLALGNHVSLVMAPHNASLAPGHHFYLVPIKHAESFVACDDASVWDEVRRFQTSLQNLYAKEGKAIILCETVLPNKGFWQTKMEVIPVPFQLVQDAPIFFKSSMVEQAEEWGTHNKLLPTNPKKPLRSVVPKSFPYFYVEWGNVSTSSNTGFAQIVESAQFRHDFGVDTIAGMMELDPIRFRRKGKFSYEEERRGINDFLAKWKQFDWTLQLDEA